MNPERPKLGQKAERVQREPRKEEDQGDAHNDLVGSPPSLIQIGMLRRWAVRESEHHARVGINHKPNGNNELEETSSRSVGHSGRTGPTLSTDQDVRHLQVHFEIDQRLKSGGEQKWTREHQREHGHANTQQNRRGSGKRRSANNIRGRKRL